MNEEYWNPICLTEEKEDYILSEMGIIDIACSSSNVWAINEDGNLITWGEYHNGLLGTGETDTSVYQQPNCIILEEKLEKVFENGAAIDVNGDLWMWGKKEYIPMGDYYYTSRSIVEPIKLKKGAFTTYDVQEFTKVDAGETVSTGIDQEGRVWLWGYSNNGLLSNNYSNKISQPTLSGGAYEEIMNDKIIDVSVNSKSVLALDKEGKVWVWGQGEMFDINTSYTINEPRCLTKYKDHILEGKTIIKIANCKNANMLIDNEGKLYVMTAYNRTKILNDENEILNDVEFIDVKGVGNDGILALDKDGNVWLISSYNATPQQIDFNGVKIKSISGSKFSNGYTHYLAIDEDGDLWVWGDNNVGQLGIPASEQTEITMPLCLTKTETISNEDNILYNKKIVKALASDRMSAVADNSGKMYTFGLNTYGQLGQNVADTSAVLGINCINEDNGLEVQDISLGKNYCLAIDNKGNIWSWGYNNSGNTGRDETYTILPLQTNGTTYKYGSDLFLNQYENISDAIETQTSIKYMNTEDNNDNTANTPNSSKIKQTKSCKAAYSYGYNKTAYLELDEEGNLWSYGTNDSNGILGDGTTSSRTERKCINYMFDNKKIDEILYFGYEMIVMTESTNGIVKDIDGNMWIWGDNCFGQCGNGADGVVLNPICVNKNAGFTIDKYISVGLTNIILDTQGKIWVWGQNTFDSSGACGTGTTGDVLEPTCISEIKNFTVETMVSLGGTNIILDTEGKIWTWGKNAYGQCGTGTTGNVLEPTCITEMNNITIEKVISLGDTNIVQDTEGRIWTWGYNYYGQCGTGTTRNILEPTCINENTNFTIEKVISLGGTNIVQDTEGRIWTWGYNYSGQCGTGTTESILEPTCINEENRFIVEKVISLGDTNIVQDTEGRIWTWGRNTVGQCGIGTANTVSGITCINENKFKIKEIIQILPEIEYIPELDSFYKRSELGCIILADIEGKIWSWGYNLNGECGTGTTENILEPTCINEETPFEIEKIIYNELSSDDNKFIIIQDTEGGIWTWGQNTYGQCGNGTKEEVSGIVCINEETPFKIEKIIYNQLSSDNNKFIIIQDTQKRIWTWGQNTYGECGTGNTKNVLSPICISNNTPMDLIESNISITNNSVLIINQNNEAYVWTSKAKPAKINDIEGINGKEIKELAITIQGIMALDIDGNLYAINDDLKSIKDSNSPIGTYGTGPWTKDFVGISDAKY